MRSPVRRISALVTFFGFMVLAPTGLIMLLSPGGQRGFGQGAVFLGMARHDWREFHEIAGIVFLVAVLIHLACNWRALMHHLGLGRPADRGRTVGR